MIDCLKTLEIRSPLSQPGRIHILNGYLSFAVDTFDLRDNEPDKDIRYAVNMICIMDEGGFIPNFKLHQSD